jgi:alcohol dehydrogenase
MLDFNFFIPTRIIFGAGRLADLASTPHLPPGKKAMIVMGQSGSMLRHGHLGRVQGYLGDRGVATVVSDTVTPNPESDQVDEAGARARELGVDFIVGLGGGSSLDAAKGVALMARNPGSIWDCMPAGSGGRKKPEAPGLPLVAIPTTAGTGSEADPWLVISKSGGREKIGWGTDATFPALSLVDPELALTLGPAQTAYTGLDAFFHAVETYVSTRRQPVSDMLALEAAHLVHHYLPEAVQDGRNLEARTVLAWASTAAGFCQSLSSCLSLHSMEHSLSAFHPTLPHGLGLALLAGAYFDWLAPRAPERFADLALAMEPEAANLPEERQPLAFAPLLRDLIEASGLGNESLAAHGVQAGDIPDLARCALETMPMLFESMPVKMGYEDVVEIFEKALE